MPIKLSRVRRKTAAFLLSFVVLIYWGHSAAGEANTALRNDSYSIRLLPDGAVEIAGLHAAPRIFSAIFTVLYRQSSPGLDQSLSLQEDYALPTWLPPSGDVKAHRTWNFFESAGAQVVTANTGRIDGGAIRWEFSEQPLFRLSATLSLAPGQADPLLVFHFVPKKEGWFSVGYSGAPHALPATVDWLWQPLIWQEKRFPRLPFLTMENMGALPATMFTKDGVTIAVVADPGESPFRMPTIKNARFGVMVRNAAGEAQPQIFAPVLGGAGSAMKADSPFDFHARLLVRSEGWYDTFTHIARDLFGFRDMRENGTCSLNTTLENMIDYALNDEFDGWNADLKGFDYTTDEPGTVKVVSALHPLSLAMITDDERIFRRRVLPMTEYLMSRHKYLYGIHGETGGQGASHALDGPAMEVADLSAMYLMTARRNPVFYSEVEQLYGKKRALNLNSGLEGASFQNLLALYRTTGDEDALEKAKAAADAYIARRIDTPQSDLSDANPTRGGQFWTDWSPRWMMLYELYQETGDRKYLAAAQKGARLFAQYAWYFPTAPEGNVTVNGGGKVRISHRPHGVKDVQAMHVPEECVPAWRVSIAGLTPEASNTWSVNPAVFLTNYAPWLLRVAHDTSDTFLHDLARCAVVGRYANYPGYCIKTEFTTVYEKPDYPLKPFAALTYNQQYYNHVWPHIALLTDYLISDVVTRSNGNIDFPSRYAQGYAYLQSKVYGDRTGIFYGDKAVWLYMPRSLLSLDTIQLNYIAGYGNGNLYLALTNQSAGAVTATLSFSSATAFIDPDRIYPVRVWQNNEPVGSATVEHGQLKIAVAPAGITAVAVGGVAVEPRFAGRLRAPRPPLSDKSDLVADSAIGKVHGMLFSFGHELKSAYVFLEATEKEIQKATLSFRTDDGAWQHVIDENYPYEFSIPLKDSDSHFEFRVDAVTVEGKAVNAGTFILN